MGIIGCLFFVEVLFAACSDVEDSSPVPAPQNQPAIETPRSETSEKPDAVDEEKQGISLEADIQNGEQIYFTAANDAGERITYSGGPDFGGMMMGSYLTCAACHGPEAQGGRHIMHMQVMDAPAVSYRALSEDTGEEHSGERDDHSVEAEEYDLEDFRLAVVEGQHPDGDALDDNMPRWTIDEEDLQDLFAFLKTLP